MKSIEAEFILHIQQDDNCAGHANGEATNIYKRKALVFEQISKRNFQIIFEETYKAEDKRIRNYH